MLTDQWALQSHIPGDFPAVLTVELHVAGTSYKDRTDIAKILSPIFYFAASSYMDEGSLASGGIYQVSWQFSRVM